MPTRQVEETFTPDALAPFVTALDDLCRLGEMDLKLNHPEAR